MRSFSLVVFSFLLAASGGALAASDDAAGEDYAIDSYEQSLKAYQLCAARNAAKPQNCSGLARLIEADKKRFERDWSAF